MSILKSIIRFFKKSEITMINIPEGICPNCWGRGEYEGKYYEAVRNFNTDVNSPNPNVGWIQDYANKYLSEIQLNSEHVCPKCKISYKPL